MKAENVELKKILGNFGENYNKFEDLTINLIRQNRDELLKLINELHNRQEQKLNEQEKRLNALKTSNEMLDANISATVTSMKYNIESDVTSLYDKIDKNASERLKKYNDSINTLEKQSKRFWAFTGIKEALFWCMCLAIIFLIGRAALDVWGVSTPVIVWQILYPCSFIPFIGYVIRGIAEIMKN
ncbi:MAG: MICOS complex subunit MIC60 [Firmicutes bacterium]|nr:MICOS complex subunit MIC60 [Bacillota bacterium]